MLYSAVDRWRLLFCSERDLPCSLQQTAGIYFPAACLIVALDNSLWLLEGGGQAYSNTRESGSWHQGGSLVSCLSNLDVRVRVYDRCRSGIVAVFLQMLL